MKRVMQRIFEYFNPAYDRVSQYVAGCVAAFVGYFLPIYDMAKFVVVLFIIDFLVGLWFCLLISWAIVVTSYPLSYIRQLGSDIDSTNSVSSVLLVIQEVRTDNFFYGDGCLYVANWKCNNTYTNLINETCDAKNI